MGDGWSLPRIGGGGGGVDDDDEDAGGQRDGIAGDRALRAGWRRGRVRDRGDAVACDGGGAPLRRPF